MHGQHSRASPAETPHIPQGSGPASAEAQQRLQSEGSQRDLSAEADTLA